jgi:sugar fermentation stimulation protein A
VEVLAYGVQLTAEEIFIDRPLQLRWALEPVQSFSLDVIQMPS